MSKNRKNKKKSDTSRFGYPDKSGAGKIKYKPVGKKWTTFDDYEEDEKRSKSNKKK